MSKIYDLLIDIFSTLTSMFMFMILVNYLGWKGALLWLVNFITVALYYLRK